MSLQGNLPIYNLIGLARGDVMCQTTFGFTGGVWGLHYLNQKTGYLLDS